MLIMVNNFPFLNSIASHTHHSALLVTQPTSKDPAPIQKRSRLYTIKKETDTLESLGLTDGFSFYGYYR
jgi:hypothetical protein